MPASLPQLVVLLLLAAAAWLGGPFFPLAVIILTAAATIALYRLFGRSGYQPSFGVGLVAALYFSLSLTYAEAQRLQRGESNLAMINVVVVAVIVVFTLVSRLSERDTRQAVLNWALTVVGALYGGLLSSYLLHLFYLPASTDHSPAANPLLANILSEWQAHHLPSLSDVGWPISPAPATSQAAQVVIVLLLANASGYFIARAFPRYAGWLLPLVAILFSAGDALYFGWAVATLTTASFVALLLATYSQRLLIPPGADGWLLPLYHHLALLAPLVYFVINIWPPLLRRPASNQHLICQTSSLTGDGV